MSREPMARLRLLDTAFLSPQSITKTRSLAPDSNTNVLII